MAAVAEGAVRGDFAWLGCDAVHDFVDHDRTMRARRRFARGQNFGDVFGVAFRRMLFVLVLESTWVLARVALAAFRSFVGW